MKLRYRVNKCLLEREGRIEAFGERDFSSSRDERWKIVSHATFRGNIYHVIGSASDAGCRSLRLRAYLRIFLADREAKFHW